MHTLSLDFETRSEVDLKLSGAYVYARDPSTEVLCAAYCIDGLTVQYWAAWAGQPTPDDLAEALDDPEVVIHAWNATFERLILTHVMGLDISISRFACTAALARLRGIPGKLETALDYLGTGEPLAAKRRGKAVMLKWCQPLPDGGWADDEDEYKELVRYCMADVESEMLIARRLRLRPMSDTERGDYDLCEQINDRGLPIDLDLALAAQRYGDVEKAELNDRLVTLTQGVITSSSQHARVKDYIKASVPAEVFKEFFVRAKPVRQEDGEYTSVLKETTDKRAREEFLLSHEAEESDPDLIEVIQIIDDAGKASVAKFAKMAARAAHNGRAEGAYILAGAIQTQRYSSHGIQMHNLPRKGPQNLQEAVEQTMLGTLPSPVMNALAGLLRPTVKAFDGRTLVWGDWSSVEARGMPWLAGAEEKLDLYRKGIDVYRVNAQAIFGLESPEAATDDQRQIGKVSELSLQFGGALGALKSMARGYGIRLADGEGDTIVSRWREANVWAARYSKALHQAFLCACARGIGDEVLIGRVLSYCQVEPLIDGTISIACTLPGATAKASTRLYYHGIRGEIALRQGYGRPDAHISLLALSLPDLRKVNLFDSTITYQKALPAGFRTERIWHGLLAENTVQALCAALLRDCLQRVESALREAKADAEVIGHTHDEILIDSSLQHAAKASKILHQEMVRVPKWLPGFPLASEVKTGTRYAK